MAPPDHSAAGMPLDARAAPTTSSTNCSQTCADCNILLRNMRIWGGRDSGIQDQIERPEAVATDTNEIKNARRAAGAVLPVT